MRWVRLRMSGYRYESRAIVYAMELGLVVGCVCVVAEAKARETKAMAARPNAGQNS
jgi:hypothetical protein